MVANGQEALTLTNSQEASNHLRREKFSVALIDFAMPMPDGVELTRRAQFGPEPAHTLSLDGMPVKGAGIVPGGTNG